MARSGLGSWTEGDRPPKISLDSPGLDPSQSTGTTTIGRRSSNDRRSQIAHAVRAVRRRCKVEPHRLLPAAGLVAYAEFDELDAHAIAWRGTAAHAMLVGTSAGSMMTELARQVADRLLKMVPAGRDVTAADLLALQDHLTRRGFALATYGHGEELTSSVLILGGVGEKGIRERFERVLRLVIDPTGETKLPAPTRLRGRDVMEIIETPRAGLDLNFPVLPRQVAGANEVKVPWLSWWFEGDDLILVAGPSGGFALLVERKEKPAPPTHKDRVAAVLDAIEGKGPNVSTHPGYIAAMAQGKDIRGFEADGLAFVAPRGG